MIALPTFMGLIPGAESRDSERAPPCDPDPSMPKLHKDRSSPATWEERKKHEEIASRKLQPTNQIAVETCKMKMNLQISSGKPRNNDIPTCSKRVPPAGKLRKPEWQSNAEKIGCVSPNWAPKPSKTSAETVNPLSYLNGGSINGGTRMVYFMAYPTRK